MLSFLSSLRVSAIALGLFIAAISALQGQTINFTSSPYASGQTQAMAFIGTSYTYRAQAATNGGGEIRYSLRFGPYGINVNAKTGVVRWQPPVEGNFDVEIRAELVDNPSINVTQRWRIVAAQPGGHPGCTGIDVWQDVGTGFPGTATGALVRNDELYMTYRFGPGFQLGKWDGTEWTALSDIAMLGDTVGQIIDFNGEIYMKTPKTGIAGIPNSTGIAKWDGNSWSGVGTHTFERIIDMETVGGYLYVLGYDNVPRTYNTVIEQWDGTNWRVVGELHVDGGVALASLNDRLYAIGRAGSYSLGLDDDQLPLFELTDDSLKLVANNRLGFNSPDQPLDVLPLDGHLFIITTGRVYKWDETGVDTIPPIPSELSYSRTGVAVNGELYVASWSDNSSSTQDILFDIWQLSGNDWRPISQLAARDIKYTGKRNLHFIEYKKKLFAYGSFNESCARPINHVAVLGRDSSYGEVSGSVYHDDDRNCSVDQDETGLANQIVEILPGPFYASTNSAGKFTAVLQPGSHSLNVSPKRHWVNSCSTPANITLSSSADVVENITLGTDMIPGIYDVRSSVVVGRPRPGFNVTYILTYWNVGTEPATGTLSFEYDSRLTYERSSTDPVRHNDNILEWDFTDLPVGASNSITVTLDVPRTLGPGTELCAFLDVELEEKDQDEFLSDNRDSVCAEVRGSYDPNDISVAPVRFDQELSNIPLLPGDTLLSYLVRFQNTGNDTAFTVVVSDTLDPNLLDIPSIRLGAASHDYDFDISGPGILTWTFKDILLPDSGANELASHGYFKYAIHLRKGLLPMTEIPNRAAIYFDYNAPVITNTVVSITSGTLGVDEKESSAGALQLYPNPVHGVSSIDFTLSERQHVLLKLIDSRGTVLAVLNDGALNAGEQSFQLDGRSFAAGAYYLVLDRAGKKKLYPVMIAK